jgi:cell wall-associated NlpC family hydrolase
VLVAGLAAALVAAVPALADPIGDKRAEARRVLAQIRELDSELSKAIEAYNAATVELDRTRHALEHNRFQLKVARRNLALAQQRLADRLRDLYTTETQNSTLEILLGATSLQDFLNRVDAISRVSDQDTEVLEQVKVFRRAVARQGVVLSRVEKAQTKLVARRDETRHRIEEGLAERQRLLASVKDEIARLEEAERRRQEALARQARARLAAQREAQREALEEAVVGAGAISPEGAVVAPPARYTGVVAIAMRYLGIPYRWGGASPETGFDCSGFIMYVYAQVGVSLPHHAATQFGYGVPVSRDQLAPGDLVFFDGLGHNGIYIGNGLFIHSPHTGDVVKISSLSQAWYASRWVGARRIL